MHLGPSNLRAASSVAILALALTACRSVDSSRDAEAQRTSPAPAASAAAQLDTAGFDLWFDDAMERGELMGAALLAREGEVLWHRTHGAAEFGPGGEVLRPLNEASIFELASVGKAFTAMAVLTLVEAGEVSLDAPVATYLPRFPYADTHVEHLLTHTSGLVDYLGGMEDADVPDGWVHNDDVVAWVAAERVERNFPAGTRFEYSNTNYLLLASIVMEVSGQDFGDYLVEHVFVPLDMQRTFSFTTRYAGSTPGTIVTTVPGDYAFGYQRSPGGELVLPELMPDGEELLTVSTVHGDGTVVADLRDFAMWEAAWTTEVLIPDALRERALSPTTLKGGTTSAYGFAWAVDPESGWVSHSGGWPGYTTNVMLNPDTRTVFVFALTAPVRDWGFIAELEELLEEL